MRSLRSLFLAGLAASVLCPAAHATNGMNMIAYDAVSAGMGGADAAVETGCTAVAANPANLSTLCKSSLVVNLSLLAPKIGFANTSMSGANDLDGKSQIFPLPFLGYANRVGESGLAWGLGLFAQGGMGVDLRDVHTNFGTSDRIYSNVRYMRLAPTLSYAVTEKLALGATVHAGYSDIAYKFFPKTSYYSPGQDDTPGTADDMAFPGQALKGARSLGVAFRAGARYEVTPKLSFGGTYTSKSTLDYKNGDLDMNFTAMGLGPVRYDASVDGFDWPAAVEGGVAVKLLENTLTIAGDAQWINWSDALKTVTVKGDSPDNPNAAPSVQIPFIFNWDDQMVYAAGAAWAFSERDIVRAGYNFASNPIPDDCVYPLFPATTESHATVGYGRSFNRVLVDLAYEHAFESKATNSNTNQMENPFGPGDRITHAQNTLHVAVTYKLQD
jgi:long-chain fatty acid transport protein